jgi:hypothetical protein
MTDLTTIAAEALTLGILIHADQDGVTFRPDGGDTCEGDVLVVDGADGLEVSSVDGSWLWAHKSLAAFVAEYAATNNWS